MGIPVRQLIEKLLFVLLTRVLAAMAMAAASALAQSAGQPLVPDSSPALGGPLIVDSTSHVVVMQYEAWFGPNAVTFQNAEAMPILQSEDMRGVGGGYDSTDPRVIRQHIEWMKYMGVDAALIDVSNNVGCIFSTGEVSSRFCNPADESFRKGNQTILSNTGNLYPAWSALGTSLKLIPQLGCLSNLDLNIDGSGKSGLQQEAEYFGKLMERYPKLNVEYQGRPLMLIFMGVTPTNPLPACPLSAVMKILKTSGLDKKYTFRIDAGYLDSQPYYWANPDETPTGPVQIAPEYGFWSWVDRYKAAYALYPTYNATIPSSAKRVENFTASIATAGENGWGCPPPTYCPDDALRYDGASYATWDDFMALADKLEPLFLIVHQFNEFTTPDEGWNANTSGDIEPTQAPRGWGYGALEAVHDRIERYRQETSDNHR
jgi:hypothetical protein